MASADALIDWFARRTFTAGDWDLDDLAERKRLGGHSVSLVLPARNEAETIAGVVESGMALQGRLVDEVIVLDGASTDGTSELATRAGAKVHQDADVLAEYGPTLGKGDALWRSLHITSGDIVAFVDTDIRNPDPRFIWSTVAPLLLDADVGYVKGFYDRPLEVGGVLQPGGGGRVTELMARPMINLFWPELAGVVQPLSGEYAARREVLEQVPFVTGYGVEIALLIDVLAVAGADAIAQVDIGRRVHRNQDLSSLSRMAFAIARVALRRLASEDRARFVDAFDTAYAQFDRDPRGRMTVRLSEIDAVERPPMASVAV